MKTLQNKELQVVVLIASFTMLAILGILIYG